MPLFLKFDSVRKDELLLSGTSSGDLAFLLAGNWHPAISRARLRFAVDASTVHIFWDHSNVYLSALDACERFSSRDPKKKIGFEVGNRADARVHFQHLYEFARAGRDVERAVAIGSIPPGLNTLWGSLKKAGIEVELQERGTETGKEQAVDEALQLHMLRSVLDRNESPAVAVVLTGDGGYRPDIERMLAAGWGVEILCFGSSFARKLRSLATESHGRAKGHVGRSGVTQGA